jgi:predicted metalloprotease with PDZ domain
VQGGLGLAIWLSLVDAHFRRASICILLLKRLLLVSLVFAAVDLGGSAAEPVRYRLSFPEPQHRWMQVEATFPEIPQSTLELRFSRSSPGRYSLHDFAKNVYDVHVLGQNGRELHAERPDPHGWTVVDHGGGVTVQYKVYGDRLDGTYLAVDTTHAHLNMPAAIMWARGLEDRAATVTLEQPPGSTWRAATQLHPGSTPLEFKAGNLQYLMDSPIEFGQIALRQFTVDSRTFRVSLHHTGTDAERDAYVGDVEKIVRQAGAIYGEYPHYEPEHYTFLVDYLPHAVGDGMEHRNSTVITSPAALTTSRLELLDTVAHEFFHGWNAERIRPRGLEPFDFDRANLSGELWLAEGFTQYYGALILHRAGLADLTSTARSLGSLINTVTNDPGRRMRSAEEMSLMAPFIDGGQPVDRTNWENTVISYYSFGGAIALALDLTLRDRTDNRVSLDDFMRAMWRKYGKAGGSREGYVDRPYTIADVEATLAEVSGEKAFARDFLARYIEGRDVADYQRLLARAGFSVRKRHPGRAWLGSLRVGAHNGVRVTTLVAPSWPVYPSGLEQDDELLEVAGRRVKDEGDLKAVLGRHKPGDRVPIVFVDRSGRSKTATVTLAEDPQLEVVPVTTPTAAQEAFRARWLGSLVEQPAEPVDGARLFMSQD